MKLDAPENRGSFTAQLEDAVAGHSPERIVVTEAGEWRVLQMLESWRARFSIPVDILPDDRFLCSPAAFKTWAAGRKQLRMEYFYRDMRRQTGLLMDGDKPAGGQWNFDAENRKPAEIDLFMPRPKACPPDAITREVLELVEARFGNHFGDLAPFWFAVTRADAEAAFAEFVEQALPRFGDYQDAMLAGEPFLYHAVIAQYLNCGLLDPLRVCREIEKAYRAGKAPLNAAEGFIRQIIGWREYVRGIYWLKMPGYERSNFFGHTRPLPDFYWTAETGMACVRAAVSQTREQAYAHHIQRLMVTGNFAMLAGVDPHALHEWYLSVYADAYEWVELPNTVGMSQFADGGLLASKPYAASGAYIDQDVQLLRVVPLRREAADGTASLSVQRALLGFHRPAPRQDRPQSANGADGPHLRQVHCGGAAAHRRQRRDIPGEPMTLHACRAASRSAARRPVSRSARRGSGLRPGRVHPARGRRRLGRPEADRHVRSWQRPCLRRAANAGPPAWR